MSSGAGARKREAGNYGVWSLPAAIGEGVLAMARRMEEIGQRIFRPGGNPREKEAAKETIGDLLNGLPAGFFLLNNYRSGHGHIDNILVGPKGIFVLKLQSHHGSVMVLGDQIFRNGRSLDIDKTLIRKAREECRALEELLAVRGVTGLVTLPIIVFTDAVVGVHGTMKGVEVLHRNGLPEFMRRRKDVISAREAEGIFEFLKIGIAGSSL